MNELEEPRLRASTKGVPPGNRRRRGTSSHRRGPRLMLRPFVKDPPTRRRELVPNKGGSFYVAEARSLKAERGISLFEAGRFAAAAPKR